MKTGAYPNHLNVPNPNTLCYPILFYHHLTKNCYVFIIYLPPQGVYFPSTTLFLAPTQDLVVDTQISLDAQEIFVEWRNKCVHEW